MSTGRQAKMARAARVRARGSASGINDKPVTPRRKPVKKKPRKIPDLWRLLYEDPGDPYGGDRLKLPSGETVRQPDRSHPGYAALIRILTGAEQPDDRKLFAAWRATIDPRYLAYMHKLAQMPKKPEDMTTGPYHHLDGTPPGARVVVARFNEALEAGTLGMCAHVRLYAPRPAYWLAWAPGKLRCYDCMQTENKRIKGQKADFTCDACGHINRRFIQSLSQLTDPISYRQILISVYRVFGLCRRCLGEHVPPGPGTKAAPTGV
jgi:hypothetical protein